MSRLGKDPIQHATDLAARSKDGVKLPHLMPAAIPTAAERSAALTAQAQSFANEAVDVVLRNMLELQADCRQLVDLQTIPAGVREHMKQLADQLAARAQDIKVIRERRL